VIELAYFDDLSPTEVAARLEAPLGTIKTRTCSALAHLADVLAHEREAVRGNARRDGTDSGVRPSD
jgi:RNA polymerase sigma-70 factor (ECF subfamily)